MKIHFYWRGREHKIDCANDATEDQVRDLILAKHPGIPKERMLVTRVDKDFFVRMGRRIEPCQLT